MTWSTSLSRGSTRQAKTLDGPKATGTATVYSIHPDFVIAFEDGGYEQGPRTDITAVPEPSGWLLMILGAVSRLLQIDLSESLVAHVRRAG